MGASLDLSQLRLGSSPAQRRFAQRNPAGQKGRDYTSNRNVPFSKRMYVNCARFNSNYSYVFEVYPHFLHFCARHFNFVLLHQSPDTEYVRVVSHRASKRGRRIHSKEWLHMHAKVRRQRHLETKPDNKNTNDNVNRHD